MPNGFKTLAGPNSELAARFGLREHPSEEYPGRTELNVRDSDGTLWFAAKSRTRGELCTFKFLRKHDKPSFTIDMRNPPPVAEGLRWTPKTGPLGMLN